MALESVPAKYAQLVSELQHRIESGLYPAGEMLPSEHRLVEEFGVSRPTVVAALRILKDEGWVEARQGKGRYVRGRPMLSTLERARAGQARLIGPETESTGEVVEAGTVPAPNRIATLLDIAPRSKVFRRQRLIEHDGEPSELVSLWLPVELSAGTDLTSSKPLPEGVREHLEARKGVRGDHVLEHILARPSTTEEMRLLGLARHAPVLVIYATLREATGRSLVVVDAVLPADRHELEDAYPLP